MNTYSDDELRQAIRDRATAAIERLIVADPMAARGVLQEVLDAAKGHDQDRAVEMQELRAESFADLISRSDYERQLAEYQTWQRANYTFQRAIGRWIQRAQAEQAIHKRQRHDVLAESQVEKLWALLREKDAYIAHLEAELAKAQATTATR